MKISFNKPFLTGKELDYIADAVDSLIGSWCVADYAEDWDLESLANDRLHYWSHWITPTFVPRRFDTWFYLAAVPEGQAAEHLSRVLSSLAQDHLPILGNITLHQIYITPRALFRHPPPSRPTTTSRGGAARRRW